MSFLSLRRLANPCLALPLLADSEGSVILGRRLYLDSIPREFQKYYSGSLFIHSVIHLINFNEPVAGRGTPSRARDWALVHSEMNCLRRHMCWKSKRFYWERAPGWRGGGWGNPGEQLCHMARSLGFYGDGISFWVIFSQSFWLRVLPGGAHLVKPRWMPERMILGGGRTGDVSFWPFPNFSGWWRLISSLFLTRTSCPKTTHANGYYGAWPGWVVSISMLPRTSLLNVPGVQFW